MKQPTNYEARFEAALIRIRQYMTPAQLRRQSERSYGLNYEEALEMAYENVLDEAKHALAGIRRKKRSASPQSAPAVATSPESATPAHARENEAAESRLSSLGGGDKQ